MVRRFAPEDFEAVIEIEKRSLFRAFNSLVYMSFYETVGEGFLVAERRRESSGVYSRLPLWQKMKVIFFRWSKRNIRGKGIGTELIYAICDILLQID